MNVWKGKEESMTNANGSQKGKKRRENQEESCIVIHLQQSKTTRSVRISINLSNASLAQKKKVVKKKEVKKKGRM
jgi:hypothetical protein